MSNRRAKRHYRVAQKEVQNTKKNSNGFYVQKKDCQKHIAIASALGLLIFLKGLLIGYYFSNKK